MNYLFSPTFYRFVCWILRHSFQHLFTLKVQGLEYLPAQGPAIICPKHQRWEDIFVTALALPPPMHFIAKVELFRRPFIRELLLKLGGVPVDREHPRATLSSFKLLPPLLTKQAYIVLYPEGTYVPAGVGPGKHRLIQMLLKLQNRNGLKTLPFVPVGIAYHPRSLGYKVKVKIGPPLSTTDPKQAPLLTQTLMTQIARLCG